MTCLQLRFFYDPSMMLTAKLAQQAPVQTVKLLNVLSGGNLDGFLQKVIKRFKLGNAGSARSEGPGLPEGLIRENSTLNVGKILTQQKIKDVVNDNSKVDTMKANAKTITDASLNALSQRIDAIKSATTIESLNSKLKLKINVKELNKLEQAERQKVEAAALKAAQKSALSLYQRGIEARLKTLSDAGVPQEHGYVQALKKVLSKTK